MGNNMCSSSDEMYELLKKQAEERGLRVNDFFEFLEEKFAYYGTDIGLNCTQKKLILFSFVGYGKYEALDYFGREKKKNITEYLAKGINIVIRAENPNISRANWLHIKEYVKNSGYIRESDLTVLKIFFKQTNLEERQNLSNALQILLEIVRNDNLNTFSECNRKKLIDFLCLLNKILKDEL